MPRAIVPGPASALPYGGSGGEELPSPRDPVVSEQASVRGVGAALHCFCVRPGHVRSLLTLLDDDDIKLYGITFTHAQLDSCAVFSGFSLFGGRRCPRECRSD